MDLECKHQQGYVPLNDSMDGAEPNFAPHLELAARVLPITKIQDRLFPLDEANCKAQWLIFSFLSLHLEVLPIFLLIELKLDSSVLFPLLQYL